MCAAGAIGAVARRQRPGRGTAARCRLLRRAGIARRRPCPPRSHLRQAAAARRLDVSADRGRHAALLHGAGARTRHWKREVRVVAEPVDRRRGAADRCERGDPPGPRADRTRGRHRFHGADRRRKRKREGTGRAPGARAQSPPARPLRRGQLRGDRRDTARGGAVRHRGAHGHRRSRPPRQVRARA